MNRSNYDAIRTLLRAHPDGMTANEVNEVVQANLKSVRDALKRMPDTYIDRWQRLTPKSPWQAVWCAVEVPEDCPQPSSKVADSGHKRR